MFGAWTFDVVVDLMRSKGSAAPPLPSTYMSNRDLRALPMDKYTQVSDRQRRLEAWFDASVNKSLATGIRGAFVEGCTHGVAVVVFSVTIGSQLLGISEFSVVRFRDIYINYWYLLAEKIAKATQAASDFDRLTKFDMLSCEFRGNIRPEISGTIGFNNLPRETRCPVLKGMKLKISED
jgi:ATP-binding cassette subfamily B (MDR/TAP) protein 1